jgi:hypothetical protein
MVEHYIFRLQLRTGKAQALNVHGYTDGVRFNTSRKGAQPIVLPSESLGEPIVVFNG